MKGANNMTASEQAKKEARAMMADGWGFYPHIAEMGLRTRARRAFEKVHPDEWEAPLEFDPPF